MFYAWIFSSEVECWTCNLKVPSSNPVGTLILFQLFTVFLEEYYIMTENLFLKFCKTILIRILAFKYRNMTKNNVEKKIEKYCVHKWIRTTDLPHHRRPPYPLGHPAVIYRMIILLH